jgi:TusE/DsrC/DsvC family sulfur relay protein
MDLLELAAQRTQDSNPRLDVHGGQETTDKEVEEGEMPVIEIAEKPVHVNEEGFMTEYDEWDEDIAKFLAQQIDINLTDEHWKIIKFLRDDFKVEGETATSRRVQTVGGVPIKEQFILFPKKPAKKMAYIAGLPKPKGCV